MTKNKITEYAIEKFAIELLEKQGYQYIYAPSIDPDSKTPEREKALKMCCLWSGSKPLLTGSIRRG